MTIKFILIIEIMLTIRITWINKIYISIKIPAFILVACFQVDLKRKDAEEELRKSKALSTLVAELSTVHSPRIEVTKYPSIQ